MSSATRDRYREIRKLYNYGKGLSKQELAKKFKRSVSTISMILSEPTTERHRIIVQMFLRGVPRQEIAEHVGVTNQRVHQLTGHLIREHPTPQDWERARKYEQIQKLYLAGMTQMNIVSQMNVGIETVQKALKAGNIPVRKRKGLYATRNKTIAKQYKKGIPPADLAKKYGLQEPVIRQIANKMGAYRYPQERRGGKPVNTHIKKRNHKIVSDHKKGMKTIDLARREGMSRSHINRILRDANPTNR